MDLDSKDNRSGFTQVAPSHPAPILIIDDDPEFREALGRFLVKLGFHALEAKDSLEGLAQVRASKPDAILLDLCLVGRIPEDTASAEFVLKILKSSAMTRDIPIFAISGIHRDAETEVRFRRLGVESFFIKSELFDTGPFIRNLRACVLRGSSASSSTAPESEDNDAAAGTNSVPGGLPFDSTVVVIDDESDTSELLKALFKGQPYKIHWADNGVRGLSLAKTELPDLAVLDLHMPGLDGKEVCRKLREGNGGLYLPILILTGDARVNQEIQCLDLGADDYLIKTSPVMRLAARIRGLIRRRRYGMDARGLIRIGGVALDCRNHRIEVAGWKAPAALTKAEAGIIMMLMSSAGRLVDSPTLHKKVCRTWPKHDSTAIKTHVSHIRHKFGDLSRLIEAVSGEEGYRFNVELAKTLL